MSLSTNEPLLVRGIHDSNRTTSTWCRLMTNIILHRWPSRPSRGRTKDAEHGLGINGSPYYFYVLRTERIYGTAVFLFRETSDPDWPKGAKGSAPFDTGDLWHDDLLTDPAVCTDQKQSIFRCYERSLICWSSSFQAYIGRNYGTINEYITGMPPRIGSPPIIPQTPPNRAPAWTWEVRIPGQMIPANLELLYGFLSEQDRNEYSAWLSLESDLNSQHQDTVLERLRDYVKLVPPGSNASVAAEHWMLEETGNE